MRGRHLEDFKVGDVIETEGMSITESQIIDFAQKFDPQPIHVDLVAAASGPFGGLIASGFHTLSLSFRLLRDTGVITGTSLGGPGGDDLRWLKPVRPGDTLRVRAEVVDVVQSRRGDRGTVHLAYNTLNQHGEVVMTITLKHLVSRRDPLPAA